MTTIGHAGAGTRHPSRSARRGQPPTHRSSRESPIQTLDVDRGTVRSIAGRVAYSYGYRRGWFVPIMTPSTLFHLHFNTPDVAGAGDRLDRAGVPLQGRIGSVRGEDRTLEPESTEPDEFRLEYQVHQSGFVTITLAPGKFLYFSHFGLIVDRTEEFSERADAHGWTVDSNDRRTFVMTSWGFQVELHPSTADVVDGLGTPDEAHLVDVTLCLPDGSRARDVLNEVFGDIPELRVESGHGPWIDSFHVVDERSISRVEVREFLGDQGISGQDAG